ncbi:MAG: HAD family phosphatase [Rhizobiaceae bacterium]
MTLPELVIFDFDGVLVDSEIIAAEVEAELLTKSGFPITADEIPERFAGLTFRDILLRIEKENGAIVQASIIDACEREIDKRLATDVRAIDGAAQAILGAGQRRCICSNSVAPRLAIMLKKTGLAPFFGDSVFSAFDTPSKKTKPAPDVFLFGAQQMGANPARTIVIEDSSHGVHAAKAAGMRVIGFAGGAHSWPGHADVLTEAGAETVVRRHADLPATIRALMAWSEPV